MSQHLLPFFPISSPILPGSPPNVSQYLLPLFPISSPVLLSNLPNLSQHSLPFFPITSPILPMNFPHSVASNSLDRLSPHYSHCSRFSPRTFPICRPRFPFCSLPLSRSTTPPPSSPAVSLPLSFSGSSHICLLSPPNLLYPL